MVLHYLDDTARCGMETVRLNIRNRGFYDNDTARILPRTIEDQAHDKVERSGLATLEVILGIIQ